MTVGSVHVHHFVPGILLLAIAGAAGMRGSPTVGVHCLIGGCYGTGVALVTDELPMLVDFRDVYWTPEGRWAVTLAISMIAFGGMYFSGLPLWRGLVGELSAQAGGA